MNVRSLQQVGNEITLFQEYNAQLKSPIAAPVVKKDFDYVRFSRKAYLWMSLLKIAIKLRPRAAPVAKVNLEI